MTEELVKRKKLKGLPLMWNYPGVWWRRAHWIKKVFMIFIFMGGISGSSIAVFYGLTISKIEELNISQAEQIKELSQIYSELKEEKAELEKEDKSEIIDRLTDLQYQLEEYQAGEGSQVLGESSNLGSSIEEALAALESINNDEDKEIFGYVRISDIKWDNLEVRKTNSITSSLVGYLKYGKIYPVLDFQDGWYRVDTLGLGSGWVMEEFVSVAN